MHARLEQESDRVESWAHGVIEAAVTYAICDRRSAADYRSLVTAPSTPEHRGSPVSVAR